MHRRDRNAIATTVVSTVIGALVAWAASRHSAQAAGLAVFGWCAIVAYVVNWVAYIPSVLARTEKYYDLTGAFTYLSVTALALILSPRLDARAWVAASLVAIWSSRLGLYLFRRVMVAGADSRFDTIKTQPLPFLRAWTMQGLWVVLTAACALGMITSDRREPFGVLGWIGLAIWLVGFVIEASADRQKAAFRANPANKGRFIRTGIWAWSRHPNYFGEITLWIGMAIIALPVLRGWRWVLLISPVFVYLLLSRVSGVPLLERQADQRWGEEPEYQRYKATTPVLIPRPPAR